ncbi:hypothetical protein SAY87_015215 [Trapa incisa]|uniref:Late embryogenesis abundant protein LEA-2 subgroup domain-containing protein n=1 Tax=Trapa incisa TaxID=236973 RepID=A0AAN7JKV2_9MYRT|nr:hypothetical protein SAY87_015215 [Trapa incisa]
MGKGDQVTPIIAGAVHRPRSDEDEALSGQFKLRQRKYLTCCGCAAALLLILAVVSLVLAFTVFRVKNPIVGMNQLTVTRLEMANGTLRKDVNVTLLADVSIKNPNVAAFRFGNTTTTIYYGGSEVGEGRTPGGKAPARRTLRLNMTLEVVPAKLVAVPTILKEIGTGALTVESRTRVEGRVKIMNMIRKKVVVMLNCTITYNVTSQGVHEACWRHVSF